MTVGGVRMVLLCAEFNLCATKLLCSLNNIHLVSISNWLGISSLFQVKREFPVWKQKWGWRPMWFWHGECFFFCFFFHVRGIKGELIHSESFVPLWQRLYVLSCRLPWQQLRSKEIFLSSSSSCFSLLFSLSVQFLVRFLPLSPSLSFPLSDLYRHGLQSFGWGIFRYASAHTHTVCLCAAGGAG